MLSECKMSDRQPGVQRTDKIFPYTTLFRSLISQEVMRHVVIVVIFTTIVTPLLLKLVYKKKPIEPQDIVDTMYEGLEELEMRRGRDAQIK